MWNFFIIALQVFTFILVLMSCCCRFHNHHFLYTFEDSNAFSSEMIYMEGNYLTTNDLLDI